MQTSHDWATSGTMPTIDVTFHAGHELCALHYRVIQVSRFLCRLAMQMLAKASAVIGTAIVLALLLLVTWILSAESELGASTSTVPLTPTSTILLDYGR